METTRESLILYSLKFEFSRFFCVANAVRLHFEEVHENKKRIRNKKITQDYSVCVCVYSIVTYQRLSLSIAT